VTSDVETRYSQTEKEALAVKYACLKFHYYLHGAPQFTVISDHKPLTSMFAPGSRSPPRIERMALAVQHLKFRILYRPGAQNAADVLSRQPLPTTGRNIGEELDSQCVAAVVEAATPRGLSMADIRQQSQADPSIRAAISAIRGGRWHLDDTEARSLFGVRQQLSADDGILLRERRIVVPASMRQAVLRLAHAGHQGLRKTVSRLEKKVWWPRMASEAERMIQRCRTCAITSHKPTVSATPLQPSSIPRGAWLSIGADLLGPVQDSMLLVCVDHYSRYPEVHVMRKTTASALIPKLRESFCRFGIPEQLVTDNGPPFNSAEFRNFLKTFGVEHRPITPLYPAANGMTERMNRGINKALRAAIAEGRDWRAALDEWLLAYRTSVHATTGHAPAELLMGRTVNDGIPSSSPSKRVTVSESSLRARDAQQKAAMKRFADTSRRPEAHTFSAGDEVLRRRQQPSKMQTPYEPEPWKVTRVDGNSPLLSQQDRQCRRHCTAVKALPVEAGSQQRDAGEGDACEENSGVRKTLPRAAKDSIKSYKE
jgi:hypothetical protein